jgi:DNA invertase Pin-like site-specific DNA recombinase
MTPFAFYGRVSTEDQQDPKTSREWQLARSESLIAPHAGEVVAEYFDIGMSRSLPWRRRPQATALLQALRDPDRGFVAVVIGEPARAFYGNQFSLTFPVFVHYGVQLWVPEVGGAVDPGSDAHDLVMSLYGGMSKGERNRIKIRVRSAMAAQAPTEGRFPAAAYRMATSWSTSVRIRTLARPRPASGSTGWRLIRLPRRSSGLSSASTSPARACTPSPRA